jgi:hypothetical protein
VNERNAPYARSQSRHQLSFDELVGVTGNHLGVFDVPCPLCNPFRRKKHLRPLRVWRQEETFATYNCVHCDAQGFAHPKLRQVISSDRLKQPKADALERNQRRRQQRSQLVRSLWHEAEPIQGTPAEKYLRSRGITCQIPDTMRFLPARGKHPPTMLAAFGIPAEPRPGLISVADMPISEIHVTRLRSDGSAKADFDAPKIMLGPSSGLPVVCAPVNDTGGLAICEGIEDALSLHQATGLGTWAAGSANRLPALGRLVPKYAEAVTISIDDDDAGRRNGRALAQRLHDASRGQMEVTLLNARLE